MELDSTEDGSKIFQFLSSPMDFIAVKETVSGKELKGKNKYLAIRKESRELSFSNIIAGSNQD